MAKICASHGSSCWGITLLNEPYGPGGDGIPRDALANFYQSAIQAARRHISIDTTIVIMDWAYWLQNYWKSRARSMFGNAGKIVFSTHFWEDPSYDLQSAKNTYAGDLSMSRDFTSGSGFELVITEYYLNNHGDAGPSDHFPYGDMTRWLVETFDQFGGSIIWNFDSYFAAYGAVDKAEHVGSGSIPWKDINMGSSPGPPTPAPTFAPSPGPSPPPSQSGQCCFGGCSGSCQGGYCGQSEDHCEGNCKGMWCPGQVGSNGSRIRTIDILI